MATVHVGANADPHRASFWLAPPEGWLVPAEGRRASTTPYVLTSTRGTGSTTTRGGHSHPRQNDGEGRHQQAAYRRGQVRPQACCHPVSADHGLPVAVAASGRSAYVPPT